MTKRIEIVLGSEPAVYVDGVRVGVRLDVTFHREGGLQAKKVSISGIPTEVEIAALAKLTPTQGGVA